MSSLLLLTRLISTRSEAISCSRRGFAKKKVAVKRPERKEFKFDDGEEVGGRDKNMDLVIRCLDAPIIHPPPPSKEEAARRYVVGRAHNIGMIELHNAREHDLSCKMRIKTHAISMLPRNSMLKAKALEIEESYPPLWRPLPTLYPPIENFDPRVFRNLENVDDDDATNNNNAGDDGEK
jgi:hypothetical protein